MTPPTRSRALHSKSRNKKWKRQKNDWYVEPIWCDERLFQAETFEGRIWDPAAGVGRILDAAKAAGHDIIGSDLVDRRDEAYAVFDFLKYGAEASEANIVCNPPFVLAQEFVTHALKLAERKVVMLLPAAWVQGQARSRWLEKTPLRRVYFLAPRPSMPPGQIAVSGKRIGQGISDFAWFVWLKGYDGHPEIRWLRRDDAVTSAHRGPEEKKRNSIKTRGRLKTAKGLPLFATAVTRDGNGAKPI